jgi:hypothetical protein
MEKITIPLEFAENIHRVLENHVSLGYAIISYEVKNLVSEDAYSLLMSYYEKYHNANCGPFNRTLKTFIDEAKTSHITTIKAQNGNTASGV